MDDISKTHGIISHLANVETSPAQFSLFSSFGSSRARWHDYAAKMLE